ncbi:cation/calcium exchanger 1-like [Hordeum vulgare subsp. vulgare]|uniref:Sodium/calcium exchanger membrane region domain-containing protein n=2 Tax=Hordeum vulgare subsp. vulgare TaxID=112509 RepID=A0A8I7B7Z7_HORVV|nr:cation/calcium exchanger 1-like [Hordeum vulgare subsp. vulgare]
MASLHRLYKSRRNAASASFLLLALVLCLSLRTRHGGAFFFRSDAGARERGSCEAELRALDGHAARCSYLRSSSHPPCAPTGYIDYLTLFYCTRWSPWLGGAAIALWLLLLFYLLGDTASEYFCASLEGLSAALRLPPAVAGVTLLSLGNGAPDVLSSVVAFASDGGEAGDVGLSGALGGALFVSTVVAGVVAIVAARRGGAVIERRGFVRDVCFLLVALCYLLAVLVAGTVTVWAAACFLSLYAAYVLLVSTSHCCSIAADDTDSTSTSTKLSDDLAAPLLLPVAVSSNSKQPPNTFARGLLLAAFHAPLYVPRRLTIPDIAGHRWSRPCAIASALFSPLLLAAVTSPTRPTTVLLAGALTGTLLAIAAAATTDAAAPPHGRYARLPWLTGGFLMSILWSYLLARELVALLVSTGVIIGVPASVLGVTVLAWGNSLGDMVADVAMATQGGAAGAQTAVAGCYAGPAFNTVVGLGLSMALAAGARYPEPYKIPVDASTYVTVAFLVAGLAWALVALPARGMRLDATLGAGLVAVYLCFIAVRVADAVGVLSLDSLLPRR